MNINKIMALLLVGVIILLPSHVEAGVGDPIAKIDVNSELLALEKQNWMNLSQEQMMEDVEYLYKTLEKNYPYFGVVKRKGIDITANYEAMKTKVANCKSDIEFWIILKDFIDGFNKIGHIKLYDDEIYEEDLNGWVELMKEDPYTQEYFAAWIKQLNNEVSKTNYPLMGELMEPVTYRVKEQNKQELELEQKKEETENVTAKIIENSKTAYININSFSPSTMKKDEKVLFDFYDKVSNFDNLIIDISNNGGGSMGYYRDLIVAPNIEGELESKNYAFVIDGENNRKYFDFKQAEKEGSAKKVELLPILKNINKEDLKEFDYFYDGGMSIKPLSGEKMFKGKIWLLVSGKVYSASESFAAFCKETGFATLVGTQTGGDGIGSEPVHIVMPNSGLIVRYAPLYGVTADGTGSEEFGTTPDIISSENETPLDTCLKIIEEM